MARRCTRTPPSTPTVTMSRSRVKSWPRPRRPIGARTISTGRSVVMSFHRSWRPARAAVRGCATPGAHWMRSARRSPRAVPRSRLKRLKESKRRLEQELWAECEANAAYEAYRARGVMRDGRRFGGGSKPYQPPETPAGKVNITDPDSKNVKTPRGYMQGYNAQAVANEQQIVIAAEVNADSSDFGHLEGMVIAAQGELERVGVSEPVEVVVADAGYWHQKQMEGVIDKGIQVLIPPDAGKRRGIRPGWDGGIYAHMRRVLDGELGGGLYRKRKAMIDPGFANTKFNRRIDRFGRRGRSVVRSEWRLITATHNLLKLHKHQIAAAGACKGTPNPWLPQQPPTRPSTRTSQLTPRAHLSDSHDAEQAPSWSLVELAAGRGVGAEPVSDRALRRRRS